MGGLAGPPPWSIATELMYAEARASTEVEDEFGAAAEACSTVSRYSVLGLEMGGDNCSGPTPRPTCSRRVRQDLTSRKT